MVANKYGNNQQYGGDGAGVKTRVAASDVAFDTPIKKMRPLDEAWSPVFSPDPNSATKLFSNREHRGRESEIIKLHTRWQLKDKQQPRWIFNQYKQGGNKNKYNYKWSSSASNSSSSTLNSGANTTSIQLSEQFNNDHNYPAYLHVVGKDQYFGENNNQIFDEKEQWKLSKQFDMDMPSRRAMSWFGKNGWFGRPPSSQGWRQGWWGQSLEAIIKAKWDRNETGYGGRWNKKSSTWSKQGKKWLKQLDNFDIGQWSPDDDSSWVQNQDQIWNWNNQNYNRSNAINNKGLQSQWANINETGYGAITSEHEEQLMRLAMLRACILVWIHIMAMVLWADFTKIYLSFQTQWAIIWLAFFLTVIYIVVCVSSPNYASLWIFFESCATFAVFLMSVSYLMYDVPFIAGVGAQSGASAIPDPAWDEWFYIQQGFMKQTETYDEEGNLIVGNSFSSSGWVLDQEEISEFEDFRWGVGKWEGMNEWQNLVVLDQEEDENGNNANDEYVKVDEWVLQLEKFRRAQSDYRDFVTEMQLYRAYVGFQLFMTLYFQLSILSKWLTVHEYVSTFKNRKQKVQPKGQEVVMISKVVQKVIQSKTGSKNQKQQSSNINQRAQNWNSQFEFDFDEQTHGGSKQKQSNNPQLEACFDGMLSCVGGIQKLILKVAFTPMIWMMIFGLGVLTGHIDITDMNTLGYLLVGSFAALFLYYLIQSSGFLDRVDVSDADSDCGYGVGSDDVNINNDLYGNEISDAMRAKKVFYSEQDIKNFYVVDQYDVTDDVGIAELPGVTADGEINTGSTDSNGTVACFKKIFILLFLAEMALVVYMMST